MSSENNVKAAAASFGTGTGLSALVGPTTNTSQPYPLPRNDFTGSVSVVGGLVTTTASTTASSTFVATAVWQASNDKVAWFAISSASATGTLTTTATGTVLSLTTAAAAGVNFVSQRYAYARVVVTETGTGTATAYFGI